METQPKAHTEIDTMLAEIRQARERTLLALVNLTEADFSTPTHMERWTEVRRVLLRFGDHMREHANQAEHTRDLIGRTPSMPQMMLQEAELAYGKLLAALIGLNDADLNQAPPEGGWSIRQVLQHTLETERLYLAVIEKTLSAQNQG